jgi:transglutaminase-like putative cysteine protease
MRWRLEQFHLDPASLRSFRQEVVAAEAHDVEVLLHARPLPAAGIPLGTAPAEMAADLASTPFVQADHPEIRRHAERLVEGAADSMAAARRLYDWVERRIEKSPTVSLPSALDVLRERVGDCNEHTYLYVALARAVGLPARIRVGLVYNEGALFYHAWPAVYVGEWVEMDPTLGQPTVDATHLALLEGELANQLELLKVMGRLQVRVLEEIP